MNNMAYNGAGSEGVLAFKYAFKTVNPLIRACASFLRLTLT